MVPTLRRKILVGVLVFFLLLVGLMLIAGACARQESTPTLPPTHVPIENPSSTPINEGFSPVGPKEADGSLLRTVISYTKTSIIEGQERPNVKPPSPIAIWVVVDKSKSMDEFCPTGTKEREYLDNLPQYWINLASALSQMNPSKTPLVYMSILYMGGRSHSLVEKLPLTPVNGEVLDIKNTNELVIMTRTVDYNNYHGALRYIREQMEEMSKRSNRLDGIVIFLGDGTRIREDTLLSSEYNYSITIKGPRFEVVETLDEISQIKMPLYFILCNQSSDHPFDNKDAVRSFWEHRVNRLYDVADLIDTRNSDKSSDWLVDLTLKIFQNIIQYSEARGIHFISRDSESTSSAQQLQDIMTVQIPAGAARISIYLSLFTFSNSDITFELSGETKSLYRDMSFIYNASLGLGCGDRKIDLKLPYDARGAILWYTYSLPTIEITWPKTITFEVPSRITYPYTSLLYTVNFTTNMHISPHNLYNCYELKPLSGDLIIKQKGEPAAWQATLRGGFYIYTYTIGLKNRDENTIWSSSIRMFRQVLIEPVGTRFHVEHIPYDKPCVNEGNVDSISHVLYSIQFFFYPPLQKGQSASITIVPKVTRSDNNVQCKYRSNDGQLKRMSCSNVRKGDMLILPHPIGNNEIVGVIREEAAEVNKATGYIDRLLWNVFVHPFIYEKCDIEEILFDIGGTIWNCAIERKSNDMIQCRWIKQ